MRILSAYLNIVRRAGLVANAFSEKSCISYTSVVCVLLLYKLHCIGVELSVGTDLVGAHDFIAMIILVVLKGSCCVRNFD
jgi:hypothetical protein